MRRQRPVSRANCLTVPSPVCRTTPLSSLTFAHWRPAQVWSSSGYLGIERQRPSRAILISDPTTTDTTSRFWVFRADCCLRLHYGMSTESVCDQWPAPREWVGWWRDSHWLDLDATDPLLVRHIEHLLRLSESLMGACR
jgi:hypothetical protein